MKLTRTLRTLAYLRPGQLAGRLRREFHQRLDTKAPPWWLRRLETGATVAIRLAETPDWPRFALPEGQPTLGSARAVVCGVELSAPLVEVPFEDPALSPLGEVNLHAFHFMSWGEVPPDIARALIDRWITAFPPLSRPAWSPWCIARRVPAWLRQLTRHQSAGDAARLASLGRQLEALSARLELDLRGNHLWDDAVALYLGGVVLRGPRTSAWREQGRRLLHEAINDQLLAGGGHGERSVMYHGALLAGLLELKAGLKASETVDPTVDEAIAAMKRWLTLTLPTQGPAPELNDHVHGLYPSEESVLSACDAAVERSWIGALDGWIVVKQEPNYLLFDAAPIGLDEQPGHAHADTLTLDWRVNGVPIIVDPGITEYAADPHRAWSRSSRAHAVLTLSDEDSAEVWHTFRVGRRPTVVYADGPEPVSTPEGQAWRAVGSHNGYRHLGGGPVVRRELFVWSLDHEHGLLWVGDSVDGLPSEVVSRLTLSPRLNASDGRLTGASEGEYLAFGFESVAVEQGRVSGGLRRWDEAPVLTGRGRSNRAGWVVAVGPSVHVEDAGDRVSVSVRGRLLGSLPLPTVSQPRFFSDDEDALHADPQQ